MPKRVVDGEAVWSSLKLSRVKPESFRAEYTNLLPLALANGVFECDPRTVWAKVYAANRPSMKPETVSKILDEFSRKEVGLLFRWTDSNGKRWGYWVGIDKPGRLPGPSRKGKHEKIGPFPPTSELSLYLNDSTLDGNGIRNVPLQSISQNQYLDQSKSQSQDPPAFVGDWLVISSKQDAKLRAGYPWVDFPGVYLRMDAWCEAKRRRLKRPAQFACNWLANEPKNGTGKGGITNATKAEQRQSHNIEVAQRAAAKVSAGLSVGGGGERR